MTPEQCRMARAGLKWSTGDLAKKAGVSPMTVSNFENGKDSYSSTTVKLQKALEGGGISFRNGCVCLDK